VPARRLLCALVCGAALAGCGGDDGREPERTAAARPCGAFEPPAGTMGGGRALECRVDGRRFLLYVPASAAGPAPLLLALHGVGGPAATPEATLEASRLDAAAEEHGFVLALPEGEDGTWDDGPGSPDVAFAGAVIDAAGEEHAIDPDRVYATGWSGGGFMAHRLACDAADRIAAIAVLHAPLRGPCAPARPPDVLQLAGEADDVLPDAGGTTPDGTSLPPLRKAMRRWEALGGRVKLVEVPDGAHAWWTEEADGFEANARIWAFLAPARR